MKLYHLILVLGCMSLVQSLNPYQTLKRSLNPNLIERYFYSQVSLDLDMISNMTSTIQPNEFSQIVKKATECYYSKVRPLYDILIQSKNLTKFQIHILITCRHSNALKGYLSQFMATFEHSVEERKWWLDQFASIPGSVNLVYRATENDQKPFGSFVFLLAVRMNATRIVRNLMKNADMYSVIENFGQEALEIATQYEYKHIVLNLVRDARICVNHPLVAPPNPPSHDHLSRITSDDTMNNIFSFLSPKDVHMVGLCSRSLQISVPITHIKPDGGLHYIDSEMKRSYLSPHRQERLKTFIQRFGRDIPWQMDTSLENDLIMIALKKNWTSIADALINVYPSQHKDVILDYMIEHENFIPEKINSYMHQMLWSRLHDALNRGDNVVYLSGLIAREQNKVNWQSLFVTLASYEQYDAIHHVAEQIPNIEARIMSSFLKSLSNDTLLNDAISILDRKHSEFINDRRVYRYYQRRRRRRTPDLWRINRYIL